MADVLINGNSMQDIGDAIREKLRVSDTYTPAEMPAAIRAISGTLPGIGYTGSDLILRDANGDISGVWYVDGEGNWVEYTTGGGGGAESRIDILPITEIFGYQSYITVESEVI